MIKWEIENGITAEIKKNAKHVYLKPSNYYLSLKTKLEKYTEMTISSTVARTVMSNENYFSVIFFLRIDAMGEAEVETC